MEEDDPVLLDINDTINASKAKIFEQQPYNRFCIDKGNSTPKIIWLVLISSELYVKQSILFSTTS